MSWIIPHFVAALQQARNNNAQSAKRPPHDEPAKFPRKRPILGAFAGPWYSHAVFPFVS